LPLANEWTYEPALCRRKDDSVFVQLGENLSRSLPGRPALQPAGEGKPMFLFPKPLEEGTVISRPNRFVMIVKTRGKLLRCHCPTTGRLGDAKISSLPCLFSRSTGTGKTQGTVQAISFDKAPSKRKSWIGINQNAANRYVEFFLEKGLLDRMATGTVRREVKLGKSRIDFLVGDTYVEVKTPLVLLPTGSVEKAAHSRFNSFDRLIRHMEELSAALRDGKKAVIAMCYLYDAPPFKPAPRDRYNARILDAAQRAAESGVHRWQVNLAVDPEGVRLIRYGENDIGRPGLAIGS
jgi:sugar fermentation stimulation protein A